MMEMEMEVEMEGNMKWVRFDWKIRFGVEKKREFESSMEFV
jgi:hypothetical protein